MGKQPNSCFYSYNKAFVFKCNYKENNSEKEKYFVVYRNKNDMRNDKPQININYGDSINSIRPIIKKLFEEGYHIIKKKPSDFPVVNNIIYTDLQKEDIKEMFDKLLKN
ncbi:hypothetical protein HYZ41_02580 [archaeon]|nr:hypothetical protein [archaeon]